MVNAGVKYPDVRVRLTGRDGNVLAVISAVIRALEDAGHAAAAAEFAAEVARSGSDRAALAMVMRTVSVS